MSRFGMTEEEIKKVAELLRADPDSEGIEALAEVIGEERAEELEDRLGDMMEDEGLFFCEECLEWCDVGLLSDEGDSTCDNCLDQE